MAQTKPLDRETLAASLQSRKWLDSAALALCLLGIGISGYLSWTHFTYAPIICTADHSCDTVNHSAYAYFPPNVGVPVAYLGLVAYIGLLVVSLVRWQLVGQPLQSEKTLQTRSRLDMLLFAGTLGGVIFSGYLTAMELWVIHAICWWCVSSAITVTLLFGIAVWRVWNVEE